MALHGWSETRHGRAQIYAVLMLNHQTDVSNDYVPKDITG